MRRFTRSRASCRLLYLLFLMQRVLCASHTLRLSLRLSQYVSSGPQLGACRVKSHPSLPLSWAALRASSIWCSGMPFSSSRSVMRSLNRLVSFSTFCENCRALSDASVDSCIRRSFFFFDRPTPLILNPSYTLFNNVCSSSPSTGLLSFTALMRRKSFSLSIIRLLCSLSLGAIFCARASSRSLVQALSRLPISVSTRLSSSPLCSNASTVFANVAGSGLLMIASISLSSRRMPSSRAGSKSRSSILGNGVVL